MFAFFNKPMKYLYQKAFPDRSITVNPKTTCSEMTNKSPMSYRNILFPIWINTPFLLLNWSKALMVYTGTEHVKHFTPNQLLKWSTEEKQIYKSKEMYFEHFYIKLPEYYSETCSRSFMASQRQLLMATFFLRLYF